MKNIVAIYGGHRRGYNSDVALDYLLDAMKSKELNIKRLYLTNMDIKPCKACNSCFKDGKCIINDEMQDVYGYFEEADIVLTSTPIYFNTLSSRLKILIERCQSIWSGKYVAGKSPISRKKRTGCAICVSGSNMADKDFECVIKVLDMFYKCINAKLTDKIFIPNTDELPVNKRPELIIKIADIGKGLIENSRG